MNAKIAIVTGGNRGLGLETARQLAQQGLQVVLTSRDPAKGTAALAGLGVQSANITPYPLDVTQEDSIQALSRFVLEKFGRVDILVNNAGIFPDSKSEWTAFKTPLDILRLAMETNTYAPFRLCQVFIPIMQENGYGRVVNVSSGMGQLSEMNGGVPGYRLSKTALNAVTRLFADEVKGSNVLINSVCPGWVRTDMGGAEADREVEQGADTIVWLATLPDDGPSGGFFRDRREIAW
jgi:NAD(P)-dependent dehydrogenase (short-subunit alcohol dehydrogenase family)